MILVLFPHWTSLDPKSLMADVRQTDSHGNCAVLKRFFFFFFLIYFSFPEKQMHLLFDVHMRAAPWSQKPTPKGCVRSGSKNTHLIIKVQVRDGIRTLFTMGIWLMIIIEGANGSLNYDNDKFTHAITSDRIHKM